MLAASRGYKNIVQLLINKRCDINHVNNAGSTAFILAVEYGFKDIVKLLLRKRRCDINHVNNDGWTALIYAAHKSHKDIVQLLVDQGCDVNRANNNGNTAVMVATMVIKTSRSC